MFKKINIVHLIPNLGIGGAENVVLNIYRKIDKQRFNLKILYWENENQLLTDEDHESGEIVRIKLGKVVSLGSIKRIEKYLKKYDADIVQTHFIDADLIGFFASKLAKISNLITIHSYPYPIKSSHCYRYKLLSWLSSGVICVSRAVKENYVSATSANPRKIHCIHNGINLSKFSISRNKKEKDATKKSLRIPLHNIIIGNVSRLVSGKGHDNLLKAFAGIVKENPNTNLLIVGDGYRNKELNELSEKLNIKQNVVFAGTRKDIPDLIDIMDIFVFPAINEAFGLCVIEAMAMGKPVVAVDHAGIPELIENNVNGILVKPHDYNAIGESVADLIKNQKKREKLGKAAKIRADHFSLENMVAKTESAYTQLVNEREVV